MYTILIVDDEYIIRKGLQVIIDWKALGVDRILTAASGEEACSILEREKVDFMMTDICMVNMNGLQLIEKVNALNTDMRIVVLTGYDNFDYARACCKLNVQDFLLKPIEGSELEKVVSTQLRALQEERDVEQKRKVQQRAEGITDQYLQEKAFTDLLDKKLNHAEIADLSKRVYCAEDTPLQAVVLLPLIESSALWREKYEYEYLMAKNICISLYDANRQGVTIEDSEGRILVIMFGGEEYDEIEERVDGLKRILQDEIPWGINLLVGSRVNGLRNLLASYNDALVMIPRVGEDKPHIYREAKSEQRLKLFRDTVTELQKRMLESTDEMPALLKAYETYIRSAASYNLSLSMLRRTTYQMLAALYYEYRMARGGDKGDYMNRLIDQLRNCKEEEIEDLGRDCIMFLFGDSDKHENKIVFESKQYICDHLQEDLTLTNLAEKFYVTPVYLSRLFKKETGIGFNEYIVSKRMEQAKSLLETTGMRSGEIAFAVGYKDVNYFSAAFKRNVGMNTKEYRSMVREG